MATPKRRAAKTPVRGRAQGAGGNPAAAAAARDLAESQRRAKDATTPIAKAATRRVVEQKLALYSPEAARQAAALAGKAQAAGKAAQPAGKTTRRSTRRKRGTG